MNPVVEGNTHHLQQAHKTLALNIWSQKIIGEFQPLKHVVKMGIFLKNGEETTQYNHNHSKTIKFIWYQFLWADAQLGRCVQHWPAPYLHIFSTAFAPSPRLSINRSPASVTERVLQDMFWAMLPTATVLVRGFHGAPRHPGKHRNWWVSSGILKFPSIGDDHQPNI